VRGDAVGVTVDVEADGASEATCDAWVQPAAQTASATAANIPRRRDRTG